jgi:chorismate synthase
VTWIIDRDNWRWATVAKNPFWCPDAAAAKEWETYLDAIRKQGSSVGAVIEIVASGIPAGLGAPIYGKLDGDLAAAMMSINAVKGVEIGAGFRCGGAYRRRKRRRDADERRRS